ncbi:MAG: UDP-glucose--hexose-1-phosphate uridylyltransferase [Firmicutes bacterium]|nr:UDP-glucose--hexose-1-phosphate uridylyltransferase [Bacillota bacterium]
MINTNLNRLLKYALDEHLIEASDYDYSVNQLLYLLKLESFKKEEILEDFDFFEVLQEVLIFASEKKIINLEIEEDHFEAKLMDCFLPRPSELNAKFNQLYKTGPMTATNYFYHLSKASNYIKTQRIDKNLRFVYQGKYAPLDITINLSKPEKDPKLIELKKQDKNNTYPICALCMENVGYYGNENKAERSNHRVIDLTINHETSQWGFQYSPYSYFNEHAIILRKEHTPMKVDSNTFKELVDFINKFPHYLMGSNAGLPIVGGSILNHYHFQGGRYEFPIEKARILKSYKKRKVEIEVLDWPLSVLRVVGSNEDYVLDMVNQIFEAWKEYSNEAIGIFAKTTESHNTITPIVKLDGSKYNFYIVLRNNLTTMKRPYGLFHPREEYFHIKKENIGLIEVMGLAVLPGRLKKELDLIKLCLLENRNPQEYKELEKHISWIEEMKLKQESFEDINLFLENQVGSIFEKVLEDCGVFKEQNQEEFYHFVENSIY